jgi:hypothetical protein
VRSEGGIFLEEAGESIASLSENRRTMGPQKSCGGIVRLLEASQESCGPKTPRFSDKLTIYRPSLPGGGFAGILRWVCQLTGGAETASVRGEKSVLAAIKPLHRDEANYRQRSTFLLPVKPRRPRHCEERSCRDQPPYPVRQRQPRHCEERARACSITRLRRDEATRKCQGTSLCEERAAACTRQIFCRDEANSCTPS